MNKQFYRSNLCLEGYLQNTIAYTLDEIYQLMKVCYGPYGSHVLIGNKIGAEAMKDGQRILSSFISDSSIPTSVLQSIKSVSNKQAEEIGDGTTTTILLLCNLYKSFRELIVTNNISPSVFNKTLKTVVSDIISRMDELKTNIMENNDMSTVDWETLRNAVYTSVDGETEICDIIIDLFKELNAIDPLVIVDTSTDNSHKYELVKGIELDGAPICPEVFFNGYSRKEINNPNIVLVNGKCQLSVQYLIELDNYCMQRDTDYIFLCTGIDDDKLSTLVSLKNVNPATLNRITFFQINITNMDTKFLDIAAALGATFIDSETLSKVSSTPGLFKLLDNNSSTCVKSLITEFCIRFNSPASDINRIDERIAEIDAKIEEIKNDPSSKDGSTKELENRRAFLSKNYAKLYIGGSSPQRRSINYELAKDGVLQAISCMKNGITQGCNTFVPYITNIISNNVTDELYGKILNCIHDSYVELFKTLVMNKYADEDKVNDVMREMGTIQMINLRENDDTPVINSAATDITILENSTDMASLLATSKAFLSTIPEFDSLNNR